MEKRQFSELIYRQMQGMPLSDDQQALLEEWLQQPGRRELYEQLMGEQELKQYLSVRMDKAATAKALSLFEGRVFGAGRVVALPQPAHRVHFLRRAWVRYAAAVILLAGAWFLFRVQRSPKTGKPASALAFTDARPGGNKATFTLANGSTITLDSVHNGILAQQGNATVVKQNNGQLAYNSHNEKPTEVLYNTLATPRGGQYQLVLPDGSKVWLNAASSIRYPTAFTGKQRSIEITGEAYFEVAKNEKMPFVVKMVSASGDKGEVKVLGTHFNVNAYDDEEMVRTTLLEGSVLMKKDAATALLKPGQQAQVKTAGINIIEHADIEKVMAWKNGYFNFEDLRFGEAMRQIERWYDIDVVYPGGVPDIALGGEISRNLKLSDLLKGLQGADVKFRLEQGRKLIVLK